ncbi:HK97 gp10 family phage protein [Peptoniphilus lacrimalis]|uniref:HK97 gp10 family phage protein n=1 Tax=Peptoniphilus lacrimalis TaxID=33031 RepID=UPI00254C611E|nr:HK97 gp10 family phage protein [Peptoniphilus lacrimalis]MDK7722488.1 HK97 gp10 family phage protein [Peptoniphilus lacrimalis]MDK7732123.1 HK97 gp10 family phage protein [Peptoniphilus lacrimalis]
MKIDTKDLKGYRNNLGKFKRVADEIFMEATYEAATRVFQATVKNTPVDTGFLRESWNIDDVKKKGSVYEIEISNDVEYAAYVEYGHRIVSGGDTLGWKDGVFMLTIAEKNLEKVMDKIFQRKFEKRFKELW